AHAAAGAARGDQQELSRGLHPPPGRRSQGFHSSRIVFPKRKRTAKRAYGACFVLSSKNGSSPFALSAKANLMVRIVPTSAISATSFDARHSISPVVFHWKIRRYTTSSFPANSTWFSFENR